MQLKQYLYQRTIIYGVVILGILIASIFTFNRNQSKTIDQMNQNPTPSISQTTSEVTVPEEERQQIEQWILNNDLNFYGDSKDTIYGGGTPLFDEQTGANIDRFEYILERHPERPWEDK